MDKKLKAAAKAIVIPSDKQEAHGLYNPPEQQIIDLVLVFKYFPKIFQS